MKKLILLIFPLFLALSSFAQITFSTNDQRNLVIKGSEYFFVDHQNQEVLILEVSDHQAILDNSYTTEPVLFEEDGKLYEGGTATDDKLILVLNQNEMVEHNIKNSPQTVITLKPGELSYMANEATESDVIKFTGEPSNEQLLIASYLLLYNDFYPH